MNLFVNGDTLREVLHNIRAHPLRTGLTAFGVAWGLFMIVLLVGMGEGLRRGSEAVFADDAVRGVWIAGGKTSRPYAGFPAGRHIRLGEDDLAALVRTLPPVEAPSVRKILHRELPVVCGPRTGDFQILGVYPGYAEIERNKLLAGRPLNDKDVEEARKVLFIGRGVVRLLFLPGEDPVGALVSIGGVPFHVVGTFSDEGGPGEERRIYLPFPTLRRQFDPVPFVDYVLFIAREGTPVEAQQDAARHALARRHRFDPDDPSAVRIDSPAAEYRKMMTLFLGLKVFVALVGLGTLLSGAVGVGNIMLVSVRERTREIGLRKVLGATPREILTLILVESLLVTALAGLAGALGGGAALLLLRRVLAGVPYFRDPQVEPAAVLMALVALVLAGLLAGFLPARAALRIQPIEALRHA